MLWVEKYRSKTLDKFIVNQASLSIIENFIKQQHIQNLLLHGTPGIGKTTLAKLLVNNIDCDYLYINASDERGIDTIREKVVGFASSATFQPLKIIILDEADYITSIGQAALRNIIEEYHINTRFILTCNYLERIIDPIQSRCQIMKLEPPSKVEIANHISKILDQEKIQYENQDVATLVKIYYPDLRKIINACEFNSSSGKLIVSSKTYSNNFYLDIIQELKNCSVSTWKNIRQIICDNEVSDFEELYKFLYDKLEDYAKGNEEIITITIEEYLYHAQFRLDKEINFMAFIAKLLQQLQPKTIKG